MPPRRALEAFEDGVEEAPPTPLPPPSAKFEVFMICPRCGAEHGDHIDRRPGWCLACYREAANGRGVP